MNSRVILVIAILAATAISRLIPHAPNLAPVTAVALFSGAWLPDRKLAFTVPLGALFLSDLALGFYGAGDLLSVYASSALVVVLGGWVGRNRSVLRIGSGALAGSVLFFVLTNFAVWAFGTMYPRTGAGLIECYAAALPFFRNTVASDLSYTAALFGGFALLRRALPDAPGNVARVH